MRLTKKLMWKIAIELWEWMAKTGSQVKGQWPGWEKYGSIPFNCPFCEFYDDCSDCPIYHCDKYAFGDWEDAETKEDRKKYAALFLEQLKEVRDAKSKV